MLKSLKFLFGLIAFSVLTVVVPFAPSAHAAPALVVLIDNGDSNLSYRRFMEAFGYVVTTNQLGKKYDVISILNGDRATGPALFQEIRKRAAKRVVDVVILSHGLPDKLALSLGDLTKAQIESEAPIPRLRMVYMMACYGASLVNSWKSIGAKSVIGHRNVNSLVPFFFPQFLANWGQGMFVDAAALQAHRVAVSAARSVNPFVKDKEDYISEEGIRKSYPVVVGDNLNIDGITADVSNHLRQLSFLTAVSSVQSGGLKDVVVDLAGTLAPQVHFDPELIASPQSLLDRLSPALWGSLQAAFPSQVDEKFPLTSLEPVWMDGDSLRLMAEPLRAWAGEKFSTVVDRLQGVRLEPMNSKLRAGLYLDRAADFNLQELLAGSNRKLGQPLALHVPQTTRLNIAIRDGVVTIDGFNEGVDAIRLTIAGPLGTRWDVWIRSVELDLESGKLRVQAAVIGNSITLWAEGDVIAKKIQGLSFWDSVQSNLPVFEWPALRFLPMNMGLENQAQ